MARVLPNRQRDSGRVAVNGIVAPNEPRWRDYVLRRGESFKSFWQERLTAGERDLLFILGKGFDPRTCLTAEALMEIGGQGRRDCVALEFDEGPASPSNQYEGQAEANWKALLSFFAADRVVELKTITIRDERQKRIGSKIAGSLFTGIEALSPYTDIVIDISAMPRDIYFPLVGNVMTLIDVARKSGLMRGSINVHVCVAEDPVLDSLIVEQGVDEVASWIHGFSGGTVREATANLPRVWIPLLGENQEIQLERISELVRPDETCPALPSPARDPRRGDNLVQTYHRFLFDRLQVDPRNFLFVSESNPFETYRRIREVVFHYRNVLEPLGGCKVVLSALSSKLLSLGALLVAYELLGEVGVAHVGSEGFIMQDRQDGNPISCQPELFSLWLAGECYEA